QVIELPAHVLAGQGEAAPDRFLARAATFAPPADPRFPFQAGSPRPTGATAATARLRLRLAIPGRGSTARPGFISPSGTARLPGHDFCLDHPAYYEATPRMPELMRSADGTRLR